MSSKKWFIMFLLTGLLLILGIAGINIVVDPFGAFGDHIMKWYAYDFTKNPRVAKISYMDQHKDEYDSFIVGSSSTSSFPVEQLNRYMDAKFYNLFMYGADMYDVKHTTEYIINNYKVKNLVLNLGFINAMRYNVESDPYTGSLHYKTEQSSKLDFYKRYLFANPNYAFEKLRAFKNDSYLQNKYKVFEVETGAYDKSVRDTESIQDTRSYLENYPVFKAYPKDKHNLASIDDFIDDVASIKALCDRNNINLLVLFPPMYNEYVQNFDPQQLTEVYTRLAEITNFWDFSVNSLTSDCRFFYDSTHFRNAMGKMALAEIFGDNEVYRPGNIGVYVTPENAVEQSKSLVKIRKMDESSYTKRVPILMYHDMAEKSSGDMVVSTGKFEEQIKALSEAGYTGITVNQMTDYVEKGIELPEKPVLITFDDGYLSNYKLAYPILKKYNLKATIFVIGVSVGKDTYKDTGKPITPHFTYEQAKEMLDSGLIDIQSHTFDMHQWADFEKGKARSNILPLEGDKENAYLDLLKKDILQSGNGIKDGTGNKVTALAYPLGKYSTLTEVFLSRMDIKATVTTKAGTNTIIKGLPQSLRAMKRFGITENISSEQLIKMIK
ncbi:MAG: hypothetical protein K0R50_334 [Eubacterium sp.]|nr:hypothetical protein [Eubacterium sp.]